ncbi:urease accessory protein UreD [Streptacidiphilus sp. PB12-B1b]|uniref:urease accessory protein UreD n=1 Tax=Streptacidiphilus sp. PB12-B1b TaxID=2705012 RepID=UPI0015FE1D10|nr:urease accessory protein UreD [Streptacidiphilus sp. PB12-B1b]QMU77400.1 urease accessory protein UreD [Streptacidiphilus sp. PB12-B1b]
MDRMTAPPGATVRAVARITATPDGRGGTALPLLAGDGPIALRRTTHPGPAGAAQVTVVGAMAAPLGGDRLRIDVHVRTGARLRVTSAAATLSLPGHAPAPARYDLDLRVDDGGELEWLPEPVIAAAGSELHTATRVRLAGSARLLLREEQILGRSGEAPGRPTARLTVHHDDRPLFDQQTDHGPGAPGWDGPARLAGHRALGHCLLRDPALARQPPAAALLGEPPAEAVLLPLADATAVLLTATAPDGLLLRRALRHPLTSA